MGYLGAAVPLIFLKHKGAWDHSISTSFGKEGGGGDRLTEKVTIKDMEEGVHLMML